MPKRIQRRRTKGWRLPEGAVCVTRPGKWGNPFETAAVFRECMFCIEEERYYHGRDTAAIIHMVLICKEIEELRGKDLACWCALDKPCHADVLLEFANRDPQ